MREGFSRRDVPAVEVIVGARIDEDETILVSGRREVLDLAVVALCGAKAAVELSMFYLVIVALLL